MRVLKALWWAAMLTVLAAPVARADEWNKKTILTFSGPVQIPGATLAAGSYVFKLADLQGNRHVVQVFDKSETKIITTILAIPNERLQPADEPLILFSERPSGSPQAVKVWFYPGEKIGNEFVYPKTQAMKIAAANHESVLAMDDASTADGFKTAKLGRFDEKGVWQAEGNAAVTGNAEPATKATTTATNSTTPAATTNDKNTTTPAAATAAPSTTASNRANSGSTPSTPAPRSTTAKSDTTKSANGAENNTVATSGRRTRTSLPRTASPLPLYELLSGLSLAGGLFVRRMRRA